METPMRPGRSSALEIVGLDHVVIRATDVDASLRFYRDALGCVEERRLEELGLIQLRCGSSLIDLVDVESPLGLAGGGKPLADHRNMDHFAISLARFEESEIRGHLESFGIEPGDVGIRYGALGNGPSMYIHDPDGNTVELKGPPNGD
jgi:glyoxylase I family protein